MLKTIICDIDGTLANVNHRRHFVEGKGKDWKHFFARMKHDTVNQWCKTLIERYDRVILVTGRPIRYRKVTEDWLRDNDIAYFELHMRPDENHDNDDEIKERIYREKIEPHFDIEFVVDDRQKVVDMWRRIGLTCLQCDYGNF